MKRAVLFGIGLLIANGFLAAEPTAMSGARIAFSGSIAPLPPGARIVGNVDPQRAREMLDLEIALRMKDLAAVQQELASGGDAAAAAAGNYPSAADYDAVVSWLRVRGFQITDMDRVHRLRIGFRGTIAQAAGAFRVRFARVQVNGEEMITAITPPSLPSVIGKSVLGINGLQPLSANRGPVSPRRSTRQPHTSRRLEP